MMLPSVTLGGPVNANIPWGSTLPSATGDYIYTSFPPAGFLVPYWFLEMTGLEPSVVSLMIFNYVLQILSCFALYVLLLALIDPADTDKPRARLAAICGVSVQILSQEALVSFGLVYWSQQLFQPVFIAFLYALLTVMRQSVVSSRNILGLGVLAFLGALIEPTAFVLTGGTILVLIIRGRRTPRHAAVILSLGAGAALAGIVFLVHLLSMVGTETLMDALFARFLRRSGVNASLIELAKGYVWSYGLLLLAAIPAIILATRRVRSCGLRMALSPPVVVFVCAMTAMIENLILMQHAVEFSFDRLKFAVPLAMLTTYAAWSLSSRPRTVLVCFLAIAVVQNYGAHRILQGRIAAWTEIDRKNHSIVSQLRENVDLRCALIGSNIMVRGYAVLLLHRNIHETMTREEFRTLPDNGACARIYLPGAPAFPNLPRFFEAIIELPTPVHIQPR